MSDLDRYTGTELAELRARITSAALRFYTAASDLTRRQAALPSLSTPELVAEWQALRDDWAVTVAAGHEQFELLEAIAAEVYRRQLTREASDA